MPRCDRPGGFRESHHAQPALGQDWKGTLTLSPALVAATQESETFNGALSLVRAEPAENWLDPHDRTIFNFSTSFGEVKQPGSPALKTSICHDLERDEYVGDRLVAFGQAAFDHNYVRQRADDAGL